MVYLFARTDSRGVILKKVAFIKAKNKEEAVNIAHSIEWSLNHYYSFTELSDKEYIDLKKRLKKKMKKTLIYLNVFEFYCESITDSGNYTKVAEKGYDKYMEKRKKLEKQFSLLEMKINPNW